MTAVELNEKKRPFDAAQKTDNSKFHALFQTPYESTPASDFKRNKLTLLFPLKTEKKFLQWYAGTDCRRWKTFIFLGWAMAFTLLWNDDFQSENWKVAASIRGGGLVLSMITMIPLFFTIKRIPLEVYEISTALSCMIFVSIYGVLTHFYVEERLDVEEYKFWDPQHVLLLVCIIPLVVRMRFIVTVPTVLISLLLGFLIGYFVFANGWRWSVFLNSMIVMISISIFNLFAQYLLESTVRKTFEKVNHLHSSKDLLQHEKDRSNHLLRSIFPESVISQLKQNPSRQIINKLFGSIVMMDIQGFTQWSSQHDSYELVNRLNSMFSGFDSLCDEYGSEKITTVGDAYIVMNTARNHQKNSTLYAMEMVRLVQRRNSASDSPFNIRVGVASGEIIASVLGRIKTRYDLLGHVVAEAQFLEQNGPANSPHISKDTFLAIDNDRGFVIRARKPALVGDDGQELETFVVIDHYGDVQKNKVPEMTVQSTPQAPAIAGSETGTLNSAHLQAKTEVLESDYNESEGDVVSLLYSQTDSTISKNHVMSAQQQKSLRWYIHQKTVGLTILSNVGFMGVLVAMLVSVIISLAFGKQSSLLGHWTMIGQYSSMFLSIVSLLVDLILQSCRKVAVFTSLVTLCFITLFLSFYSQLPEFSMRSGFAYVIVTYVTTMLHFGMILRFTILISFYCLYYISIAISQKERPFHMIELLELAAVMLCNLTSSYLVEIAFKQSYKLDQNIKFAIAKTETEHEKSEKLLQNVLPKKIILHLKRNPETIVECCKEATIIFAQISNFDALIKGAKDFHEITILVRNLNSYWRNFDSIVMKREIEKIKQIGSLFMASHGTFQNHCDSNEFGNQFPITSKGHVEMVAKVAQDIMSFCKDKLFDSKFKVRCGIHSGKCICAVIGHKQFTYDLFGTTINTASRMMSNADNFEILVSATSYEVLKTNSHFSFATVKHVQAKGLGTIKAYPLVY